MAARRSSQDEPPFDGEAWTGYRTYVTLVREPSPSREPYRVHGPADIFRLFSSLSGCDRERFYTVHLDRANQVCGVELISQGTVDSSLVSPREVYKGAILASASGIIVLHNHPSGDPNPSSEDRSITRILQESGQLLGIPLMDHVVIGDGCYCSFSEEGIL